MLTVNKNIILRNETALTVLYNPVTGMMQRINPTGVFIWQCLSNGIEEAEIVSRLRAACSSGNADVEKDVHEFLGMLAAAGYLAGFEGECAAPPPEQPLTSLPDNRVFYTMNSMRRVFTPGDALILQEQPFSEFQRGDIAVFYPDGEENSGIVHRVIASSAGELTTMGDNNPAPDRRKVTADDLPRLVTAKIRPDGTRFEVPRGKAGMRQFRINRFRYWNFRIFSMVVHKLQPLLFFRKAPTGEYRFDTTTQYYYKRRLIAKKENGAVEYLPFWNVLFYKLPEER